MQINAYSNIYDRSSIDKSNSSTSTPKDSQTLDINDFLNLLAAQLANQDAMNPTSDTEFIAQLAQFSSLQAMESMTYMTGVNQSMSLVGRTVVVAEYDKIGNLKKDEGVVDRVTFLDGKTQFYVNDNAYDFENIMEIKDVIRDIQLPNEANETKINTDDIQNIDETQSINETQNIDETQNII